MNAVKSPTLKRNDPEGQKAYSHPLGDRESFAIVLHTPSTMRVKLGELARALEAELLGAGTPVPRPHLDAAMVTQVLEHAPYVSVALRAHELCMEAMAADIRGGGHTWPPLNDLALNLYEALSMGAGLTLEGGTWRISTSRRDTLDALPIVADLAFDVGDFLETVED